MKKIVTTLGITAAVAGSVLVSAGSAHAGIVVHQCSYSGAAMCLFYSGNGNGSGAEFGSNVNVASFNYNINGGAVYEFMPGSRGTAGNGQHVWNNAGGARNFSYTTNMLVYSGSNYTGAMDRIAPASDLTLSGTRNNNASMKWQ